MFLGQATGKHNPPPSRTIKTQTPAQKRLPKETFELQNEEELLVAMVRKKTLAWAALALLTVTRTKDSTVPVSILHVAPPIVIQLLRSSLVGKYDMSHVHTVLSGAAPLSAQLTRQLEAKMRGVVVTQGYGMTEAGPGTHMSPRSKQKPGSVGIILPNTECKVNDLKTGRGLPAHRYGELSVRGPQVMIGYRNNQSQTATTIDKDGWLHTGDVGFYDNEGYFYIVDRLKEIIKYKGFQVSPVWLEGILLDHPLIADAAVVGVPDKDTGQLPQAFVVKTPEGHELTETDVVKYVADRVSPHRQLRGGVVFVASIPKSRTGKIMRRTLNERLLAATPQTKSKL